MSNVFPGVDEVLANADRPVNILIKLLFPTLLLPIKAYSGIIVAGH